MPSPPPPSEAQSEEVSALLAIYDDLHVDSTSRGVVLTCEVAAGPRATAIGIRILLPPSYPSSHPSSRPSVEVTGLPRGTHDAVQDEVEAILDQGCGEPRVFDVLSYLRSELMSEAPGASAAAAAAAAVAADDADGGMASADAALTDEELATLTAALRAVEVDMAHGPLVVERKSTFQAHVARVKSVGEVRAALGALLANPRISKATHNMFAYRFTDPSTGALVADNDDDGEDAAGTRLAELLELMRAEDVVVVVSRWYGGVLLGPSRFRVICNVAREMIEGQPWFQGRGSGGVTGKRGGGKG
jgi:hypothetical protein